MIESRRQMISGSRPACEEAATACVRRIATPSAINEVIARP